jgi:arsenite methyltransferase
MSDQMTADEIRQRVRSDYAEIAKTESSCGCAPQSCCDGPSTQLNIKTSEAMGYGQDELADLPEGANMGLGCGNPHIIAALKEGETYLDLGSGGGIDCFIAAKKVGPTGRAIGVDMTPDMISKARKNAEKVGAENVEFRLGEIEHLPLADNTVNVITSNCVVNLSPDKASVCKDSFRVLKPGGRLAISDMVATQELTKEIRDNMRLYSGCIAGAASIDSMRQMLEDAGFENIHIDIKEESRQFIKDWAPDTGIEEYVVSADIQAVKPV